MPCAIEIANISREFGDVTALDGISLTVPDKGVFGFLGVNGAGKTTAIRILTGFLSPTSGEASIFGEKVTSGNHSTRARIGYLPQELGFYNWMSGHEFLLYCLRFFSIKGKPAADKASELLDKCGLADAAGRRIRGYSVGMKQRLGIAQALVNDPGLLIFDEPVSSLDPVGRADVLELIRGLGEKSAVFMSSHILSDIERVCKRVAILDRGKIIADEEMQHLRDRFILPLVEVTLQGDAERFMEAAANCAFTKSVALMPKAAKGLNTETVRVTVTDNEAAAKILPRAIIDTESILLEFKFVTPSLEDIFMQLVRHDSSNGGAK